MGGTAASLKPLVWLAGEIKTPPFTKEVRIEAGTLLLPKKTQKTPAPVIAACRRRLADYLAAQGS